MIRRPPRSILSPYVTLFRSNNPIALNDTFVGSPTQLTYVPNADYNGPDSSAYNMTDTGDNSAAPLSSAHATISITVNSVNDNPIATDDAYNTNEDTLLAGNV